MVLAELCFADFEAAAAQCFGFVVLAHLLIEKCQIAQNKCHIGMGLAQFDLSACFTIAHLL